MTEKWVQRTAADYSQGLNNLLPTGPAWPRQPETVLQKVVAGLSGIWGDKVETLAALLLTVESDARSTANLLPEWERAFGLPDKCLAEPLTIGDRRTALVQRMTLIGAQDRAFFIALATAIGFTITITEYRPFMVGIDRVGDNRVIGDGTALKDQFGHLILNPAGVPVGNAEYSEYPYMLGPPENRFYWTVHVGRARLTWFRVTAGQTGVDPHLRIGQATDLECLLRRCKPAHTQILFDYSGLAVGGSMAGTP
jgi:uncharacterized protein YmfQ (DUF2313 family)